MAAERQSGREREAARVEREQMKVFTTKETSTKSIAGVREYKKEQQQQQRRLAG